MERLPGEGVRFHRFQSSLFKSALRHPFLRTKIWFSTLEPSSPESSDFRERKRRMCSHQHKDLAGQEMKRRNKYIYHIFSPSTSLYSLLLLRVHQMLLLFVGYWLSAVGCRLSVVGCRLSVMGCWSWVVCCLLVVSFITETQSFGLLFHHRQNKKIMKSIRHIVYAKGYCIFSRALQH